MNSLDNNSLVCFCHKRTAGELVSAYQRLGNLDLVQKETKAGMGCGGCRLVLFSIFGEVPKDLIIDKHDSVPGATACVKPGMRLMKGLVVANGEIESTIYASNAVPPQFMGCDSTTDLEYALFNLEGQAVLHRVEKFKTNETFVFNTRNENLPRPFYGLFLFQLKRANYGASRFNVYWSNTRSTTTTHEVGDTGRPDVHLPFIVDRHFLQGPNRVYVSIQNTYNEQSMPCRLKVYDTKQPGEIVWECPIPRLGTRWFDALEQLFRPALEKRPDGEFALRIYRPDLNCSMAPNIYFFMHNTKTNLLNVNHI
jgi:hypothetical protein